MRESGIIDSDNGLTDKCGKGPHPTSRSDIVSMDTSDFAAAHVCHGVCRKISGVAIIKIGSKDSKGSPRDKASGEIRWIEVPPNAPRLSGVSFELPIWCCPSQKRTFASGLAADRLIQSS